MTTHATMSGVWIGNSFADHKTKPHQGLFSLSSLRRSRMFLMMIVHVRIMPDRPERIAMFSGSHCQMFVIPAPIIDIPKARLALCRQSFGETSRLELQSAPESPRHSNGSSSSSFNLVFRSHRRAMTPIRIMDDMVPRIFTISSTLFIP